jgi:hypothetical protein
MIFMSLVRRDLTTAAAEITDKFTGWTYRLDKSLREPGAPCELADTLPFLLSDASALPSPKALA